MSTCDESFRWFELGRALAHLVTVLGFKSFVMSLAIRIGTEWPITDTVCQQDRVIGWQMLLSIQIVIRLTIVRYRSVCWVIQKVRECCLRMHTYRLIKQSFRVEALR